MKLTDLILELQEIAVKWPDAKVCVSVDVSGPNDENRVFGDPIGVQVDNGGCGEVSILCLDPVSLRRRARAARKASKS